MVLLLKYRTALAFIFLALVVTYFVNNQASTNAQTLYQTQLAGCIRSNSLRVESNKRIAAHLLDRDVLGEFLESAAEARKTSGSATDKKAAAKYLVLKKSLKKVDFSPQELINCKKVVIKP